jgi:hypothetical protein
MRRDRAALLSDSSIRKESKIRITTKSYSAKLIFVYTACPASTASSMRSSTWSVREIGERERYACTRTHTLPQRLVERKQKCSSRPAGGVKLGFLVRSSRSPRRRRAGLCIGDRPRLGFLGRDPSNGIHHQRLVRGVVPRDFVMAVLKVCDRGSAGHRHPFWSTLGENSGRRSSTLRRSSSLIALVAIGVRPSHFLWRRLAY